MNRPSSPTGPIPAAAAAADPREQLSRLVDGDCDGTVTPAACARWSADDQARATWHCYHLIGDVLRSEDLRPSAQGDAAFLAALRQRLADEPAIAAPRALAGTGAAGRSRVTPRWAMPSALVAGVVAVAGVTMLMRAPSEDLGAGVDARLASRASPPLAVATTTNATSLEAQAAMIRDARLDRYMLAHHGMRVGATAALPGGGLRNVDMFVPSR